MGCERWLLQGGSANLDDAPIFFMNVLLTVISVFCGIYVTIVAAGIVIENSKTIQGLIGMALEWLALGHKHKWGSWVTDSVTGDEIREIRSCLICGDTQASITFKNDYPIR